MRFFSTGWIIVLFINSPNVDNRHCGALKEQAPGSCRRSQRKTTHNRKDFLIFVELNVFLTLHQCEQKTVRETCEQKAEVLGPHHRAVMVLQRPPEGFIPAQGGTEHGFFSLQVASGSAC